MNDRQRFQACMHYQPVDRVPFYDFSFWEETLPLWHEQGLPTSVDCSNSDVYFGMDQSLASPASAHLDSGIGVGLLPNFGLTILEDQGDHEIVQQPNGVRVLRKKVMGSIPMHKGHLLVDRASWKKHYLPKLNPDDLARLPGNPQQCAQRWNNPDREHIQLLNCGSLYGWIRDWMGIEQASYLAYDDPALLEEMITTLADVTVATLTKTFEITQGQFEAATFWEDICFNTGPLIAPDQFKKILVPQYRRITDLLRKNGVDIIWVDCDGMIDQLLPLWIDAGVNTMFPLEVGTWNADPVAYRKIYGQNLRLMGGVGKSILAGDKQGIDQMIHHLAPLVEEGGYIPMPDHRVPPDVPFENYMYYLKLARTVWGKDTNLRPLAVSLPSHAH